MRILIYTPLNTKECIPTVRMMAKFIAELPKANTFSVPGFMDWAIETKKVKNFEAAYLYSILAVSRIFKKDDTDYIVIGNAPTDIKFDVIIGFNSDNELVAKHDFDRDELRLKFKGDPKISKLLDNLYTEENCESHLVDINAIVQFIKDVLKNGPNKN